MISYFKSKTATGGALTIFTLSFCDVTTDVDETNTALFDFKV